MMTSLMPLLLQFLSDRHDDTASAVFGFANAILTYYKKEKKRAAGASMGAKTPLAPERRQFLTELLKTAVAKMEYTIGDDEWSLSVEGEEDEDEQKFAELRKVSTRPSPAKFTTRDRTS